jgi:hypothetical protein
MLGSRSGSEEGWLQPGASETRGIRRRKVDRFKGNLPCVERLMGPNGLVCVGER